MIHISGIRIENGVITCEGITLEGANLSDVISGIQNDLQNHIEDTSTHGTTGDIVGTTDEQTLTNKTINASNNTISNIDHTTLTNIGTNSHAQIDTHIGSTSNPHSVTLNQANTAQSLLTTTGDIMTYDSGVGSVERLAGSTSGLKTSLYLRPDANSKPSWDTRKWAFRRFSNADSPYSIAATVNTFYFVDEVNAGEGNFNGPFSTVGSSCTIRYSAATDGYHRAFLWNVSMCAGCSLANHLLQFIFHALNGSVGDTLQLITSTTQRENISFSMIIQPITSPSLSEYDFRVSVADLTTNSTIRIYSFQSSVIEI